MRILIVDTNIVFNAIISAGSRAANILLNPPVDLRFVSCHFLQIELFKHKGRISQLSGLTDDGLIELLYELMSHIEFVNETYQPFAYWQDANMRRADIDPNDTPSLPLAIHLGADLWTGDH